MAGSAPDTPQSPGGDQLDFIKLDQVPFSTRAPNAKDRGMFWIKYTAASDTTITYYIRHPKSGTWRSVNLT